MRDALNVWMNGELVGVWFSTRSGNPTFAYEESWLRSPAARALSLSLPITAGREIRGPAVENYFDNLLPDNEQIRKRLRSRFKARSTEAFDLLFPDLDGLSRSIGYELEITWPGHHLSAS